mmetsp:Transcript_6752/g.16517  ORF Transcript_6752/g.16517 Transcript_6752/m.16517 type:complete len:454 (+) Transcript_6752:3749-5110(+)
MTHARELQQSFADELLQRCVQQHAVPHLRQRHLRQRGFAVEVVCHLRLTRHPENAQVRKQKPYVDRGNFRRLGAVEAVPQRVDAVPRAEEVRGERLRLLRDVRAEELLQHGNRPHPCEHERDQGPGTEVSDLGLQPRGVQRGRVVGEKLLGAHLRHHEPLLLRDLETGGEKRVPDAFHFRDCFGLQEAECSLHPGEESLWKRHGDLALRGRPRARAVDHVLDVRRAEIAPDRRRVRVFRLPAGPAHQPAAVHGPRALQHAREALPGREVGDELPLFFGVPVDVQLLRLLGGEGTGLLGDNEQARLEQRVNHVGVHVGSNPRLDHGQRALDRLSGEAGKEKLHVAEGVPFRFAAVGRLRLQRLTGHHFRHGVVLHVLQQEDHDQAAFFHIVRLPVLLGQADGLAVDDLEIALLTYLLDGGHRLRLHTLRRALEARGLHQEHRLLLLAKTNHDFS